TPLMDGKMAVGHGVTTPYGIGSEWDKDSAAFAPATATTPPGVLRYTSTYYAELQTININPTVAFRLADRITVGAGLDAMWSQVTLKQFYPWAIFPGSTGFEPDGNMKGEGDGWGWGGNVGITFQITDRQRLAVTYRSQMDVDYSGDFDISNITPTAASFGATSSSDFDTKIKFPNILAVGYGVQVTDKVRLEANVEWIQFSRFKTLNIDAGNNNVLLPPSSQSVAQDWKDTYTVGIGGDWRFADRWVLRSGFQYYDSPVPDSTFSPTVPDANQYVFTIGLGFKGKHNSFEFAYGLDFYDQRKIENDQQPAFNGKYDITVHLFSVAYRYEF
ncbi:MAG TPA: outer membrane protein transport protein, partial [Verrucomicrobiota bacterium]|nr:outer membrane protein transport protein [Verrucomicrobiota bacterium]